MTSHIFAKLFTVVFFFATSTVAQLSGSLIFDGLETIQVTLINNSPTNNFTFLGTNNLFDRQVDMAYAPVEVTTLAGQPVTLNGTEHRAPPLTEDVFQDIPPRGTYNRNLNMSQYLLGGYQGATLTSPSVQSMCFIASLPSFFYGVNVTGIKYNEGLANYILTDGLKQITVQSQPLHFNFSVTADFTPDQAAAIADDTRQRELAERTGRGTIQTKRRVRRALAPC